MSNLGKGYPGWKKCDIRCISADGNGEVPDGFTDEGTYTGAKRIQNPKMTGFYHISAHGAQKWLLCIRFANWDSTKLRTIWGECKTVYLIIMKNGVHWMCIFAYFCKDEAKKLRILRGLFCKNYVSDVFDHSYYWVLRHRNRHDQNPESFRKRTSFFILPSRPYLLVLNRKRVRYQNVGLYPFLPKNAGIQEEIGTKNDFPSPVVQRIFFSIGRRDEMGDQKKNRAYRLSTGLSWLTPDNFFLHFARNTMGIVAIMCRL